jgi:hypothetical protein
MLAFPAILLLACNRNKYEVIERTEDQVPNLEGTGTHAEVRYILLHDGHKIYASCDTSTFDNLDTNARCGFRPLRTYECFLGNIKETDPFPLSDLKCKDSDGHNVYLYVDKKE